MSENPRIESNSSGEKFKDRVGRGWRQSMAVNYVPYAFANPVDRQTGHHQKSYNPLAARLGDINVYPSRLPERGARNNRIPFRITISTDASWINMPPAM